MLRNGKIGAWYYRICNYILAIHLSSPKALFRTLTRSKFFNKKYLSPLEVSISTHLSLKLGKNIVLQDCLKLV